EVSRRLGGLCFAPLSPKGRGGKRARRQFALTEPPVLPHNPAHMGPAVGSPATHVVGRKMAALNNGMHGIAKALGNGKPNGAPETLPEVTLTSPEQRLAM